MVGSGWLDPASSLRASPARWSFGNPPRRVSLLPPLPPPSGARRCIISVCPLPPGGCPGPPGPSPGEVPQTLREGVGCRAEDEAEGGGCVCGHKTPLSLDHSPRRSLFFPPKGLDSAARSVSPTRGFSGVRPEALLPGSLMPLTPLCTRSKAPKARPPFPRPPSVVARPARLRPPPGQGQGPDPRPPLCIPPSVGRRHAPPTVSTLRARGGPATPESRNRRPCLRGDNHTRRRGRTALGGVTGAAPWWAGGGGCHPPVSQFFSPPSGDHVGVAQDHVAPNAHIPVPGGGG